MQPSKPDIELGTVSFRSKLDEIIINFYQKWAMYDFPFEVGSPEEEEEDKDSGAAETLSHTTTERTKSLNGIDGHRGMEQANGFTFSEDCVDGVRTPQDGTAVAPEKTHTTGDETSTEEKVDVDLLIHLPEYSSEGWLQEWTDISEYDDPGLTSDDLASEAGDKGKADFADEMNYKAEIV